MPLAGLMDWVRSKFGAGDHARNEANDRARSELQANAEKALAMKREAGAGSNIPSHQTSNEGMRPANDSLTDDPTRAADAGFTPQMKRSHVARSGDGS